MAWSRTAGVARDGRQVLVRLDDRPHQRFDSLDCDVAEAAEVLFLLAEPRVDLVEPRIDLVEFCAIRT